MMCTVASHLHYITNESYPYTEASFRVTRFVIQINLTLITEEFHFIY